MSTNGAAIHFGIPRTTLSTKLRCGDTVIKRRGPKRALEDAEEEEIVKWLKTSAERCRPHHSLQSVKARSQSWMHFPAKIDSKTICPLQNGSGSSWAAIRI